MSNNRPIARLTVTHGNAGYFMGRLIEIAVMKDGLTRALNRVMDWINWGSHIGFTMHLADWRAISPEFSCWADYSPAPYISGHQRSGMDNIDFQLALFTWALRMKTVVKWTMMDVGVQDYRSVAPASMFTLNFIKTKDGVGSEFWVPQFKFTTVGLNELTLKQKQGYCWILYKFMEEFNRVFETVTGNGWNEYTTPTEEERVEILNFLDEQDRIAQKQQAKRELPQEAEKVYYHKAHYRNKKNKKHTSDQGQQEFHTV